MAGKSDRKMKIAVNVAPERVTMKDAKGEPMVIPDGWKILLVSNVETDNVLATAQKDASKHAEILRPYGDVASFVMVYADSEDVAVKAMTDEEYIESQVEKMRAKIKADLAKRAEEKAKAAKS